MLAQSLRRWLRPFAVVLATLAATTSLAAEQATSEQATSELTYERDVRPILDPATHITEAERSHWAYQSVERPEVPEVTGKRARTPVDRFLLSELEANGLSFSPDADRAALVRRVDFDLLGLPPSPAEVERFLADDSPGAYTRLLDRVLSSPHYGERWGRHWLDVAGHADSEGYTAEDPLRPYAYKYRAYGIAAFNEDKPFDQFIVEQLAGDELLTPPLKNLTPEQAEKLIATGFWRMAPDGTGGRGVDQDIARNDVMAKTIEIVSTSLLGLTVGCAQCHDHRYDPISHVDYHASRAIFEPGLDWKRWLPPARRRISLYTDEVRAKATEIEAAAKEILEKRSQKQQEYIEATFHKELAKLDEALHEPITEAPNARQGADGRAERVIGGASELQRHCRFALPPRPQGGRRTEEDLLSCAASRRPVLFVNRAPAPHASSFSADASGAFSSHRPLSLDQRFQSNFLTKACGGGGGLLRCLANRFTRRLAQSRVLL